MLIIRINKSTYARIRTYILIHWYIRMPKITINHCFCCIRIKCCVLYQSMCACVCVYSKDGNIWSGRRCFPIYFTVVMYLFIYFGKLFFFILSFVCLLSFVRMLPFQVHSIIHITVSQLLFFGIRSLWIVFIYVK